jgi:hypothetical protein
MKENKTNFSGVSIIMATSDLDNCCSLLPEPPHVRAEDIWPDWFNNTNEVKNEN